MTTIHDEKLIEMDSTTGEIEKKLVFLGLMRESRNLTKQNQDSIKEIQKQAIINNDRGLELNALDYEILSLERLINELNSSALLHQDVKFDDTIQIESSDSHFILKQQLENELSNLKTLVSTLDSKKIELKTIERILRSKAVNVENSARQIKDIQTYAEKVLIIT